LSVVDHNAIDVLPRISEAEVGDYLALLKPRVMSLVIFTALVGLVIAPGHVHPVLAFTAILCIAVGAGASGAMNMAYEGDIDALMSRTANRPIPRGRITSGEAMAFGLILAFFSVLTLGILVNLLAGALLAFTIFFYVVIYTMWLKRWTAQNIVIGGAAGALPPVGGVGRGHRLAVDGAAAAVPHHLLLDPAAFLGAGAVPQRRLCPRRHSDAARRRRARCDAAADPALHDRAGRDRRRALAARLFRRDLWRHLAGARRRHDVACDRGLPPPRGQAGAARHAPAVCLLDPVSVRAVCDPPARGRGPRAPVAPPLLG
jgi:hypothetical protein